MKPTSLRKQIYLLSMRSEYNVDICIVGLGPAGIGAALTLSRSACMPRVLCLEAGDCLDKRQCTVLQNGICEQEEPCRMISGVGGCSTLSAAKISAFPAGSEFVKIFGSKDLAERKLLEAFALFTDYISLYKANIKADYIKNAREKFKRSEFKYKYYDVYLFDQKAIRKAYESIFSTLEAAGIESLLNTRLSEVIVRGKRFKLTALREGQRIRISSNSIVLGIGRLGEELIRSINGDFNLGGKENHLELGVRLEFPKEIFPDIDKYHKDLKVLFGDFRTYCACKEGTLAPYYLNRMYRVDGYYDPANKTNFTSIGIMLRLKPSTSNSQILNEIKKRSLKVGNGKPVRQTLVDYLDLEEVKKKGDSAITDNSVSFWSNGQISCCFPKAFSARIKKGVHNFVSNFLPKEDWRRISVFAPAIEYTQLRFPIRSDFSILPKMYLIGDCVGRFRGILQAFCSGVTCAQNIVGNMNEK